MTSLMGEGLRWGLFLLMGISVSACTPYREDFSSQPMTHCGEGDEFVFIPEGEFIAGSDRTERDYGYEISAQSMADRPQEVEEAEAKLRSKRWFEWEKERYNADLPAYCISRHLVTNQDYQEFVQDTGYNPPYISPQDYQKQGFLVHSYDKVTRYLWEGEDYPKGEGDHPVVLVSYEDALAFAAWKSEQDDYTYRLPTDLEWEKAARGEEGRYFPWGNEWDSEATNWGQSGKLHTSAIAAYPLSRSIYGVEDMAGNVFEWTSTLEKLDRVSVLKGCSWDDLPGFCRAAYRHTRPIESRHILFGFRLLLEF